MKNLFNQTNISPFFCLNKFGEAIQLYQSNLDSQKEIEKHDIRTNCLQSIHVYHNYIEALNLSNQNSMDLNNNKDDSRVKKLGIKLKEYETSHVSAFEKQKLTSEQKLEEILKENNFFTQSKSYIKKRTDILVELLNDLKSNPAKAEEFWKKITTKFGTNKADDYLNQYIVENTVCGKVIKSIDDLKLIIVDEFEKLLIKRESALEKTLVLFDKQTKVQIKGMQLRNHLCIMKISRWGY